MAGLLLRTAKTEDGLLFVQAQLNLLPVLLGREVLHGSDPVPWRAPAITAVQHSRTTRTKNFSFRNRTLPWLGMSRCHLNGCRSDKKVFDNSQLLLYVKIT